MQRDAWRAQISCTGDGALAECPLWVTCAPAAFASWPSPKTAARGAPAWLRSASTQSCGVNPVSVCVMCGCVIDYCTKIDQESSQQ